VSTTAYARVRSADILMCLHGLGRSERESEEKRMPYEITSRMLTQLEQCTFPYNAHTRALPYCRCHNNGRMKAAAAARIINNSRVNFSLLHGGGGGDEE
jgi:hypothetical protein